MGLPYTTEVSDGAVSVAKAAQKLSIILLPEDEHDHTYKECNICCILVALQTQVLKISALYIVTAKLQPNTKLV